MPKRIQMSRQRPWRVGTHEVIVVARPSRWESTYATAFRAGGWAVLGADGTQIGWAAKRDRANEIALAAFRGDIIQGLPGSSLLSIEAVRNELAGHDLACWCRPSQACHADVLLEIANGAA